MTNIHIYRDGGTCNIHVDNKAQELNFLAITMTEARELVYELSDFLAKDLAEMPLLPTPPRRYYIVRDEDCEELADDIEEYFEEENSDAHYGEITIMTSLLIDSELQRSFEDILRRAVIRRQILSWSEAD